MARDSGMYESLQDVSMLSSPITTKERLQLCCKPTYKPRRVKNKGAILVLVWNHLIMSVFYYLKWNTNVNGYEAIVWVATFSFTLPIAGWLADARIGRYKVICCSVWIMWIATILATMSSVMHQFNLVDNINTKVVLILRIFMAIGFGAYQTNILQFGMDQLHDASTTEIKSFIMWYVWTTLSAGIIIDFISACLREQYMAIRLLIVSANLSLALILLFCCNYWLIKEPVKHNSFKLVYKVIKFAIKHKHPRQRSAFTYCEDELPSRIDFGKCKYGGPFTTEQVEDVKTFLRLIPMAVIGGALAGVILVSGYFRNQLNKMFVEYSDSEIDLALEQTSVINCYGQASFTHTKYSSAMLLILLHEILLYPIFYRTWCFSRVESLHKVSIGMLLQLVRVLILMAYEIVSNHNYLQKNSNETILCLFYAHQGTLSTSFDYHWIIIPDFIQSISLLMLYTGVVEYFTAQVPYFMKGLTVGITYFSILLSGAIWFIPFYDQNLSYTWGKSCGMWYALLLSVLEMSICVILIILTRWHKKRRRQDVLPNEHIFAERYYST